MSDQAADTRTAEEIALHVATESLIASTLDTSRMVTLLLHREVRDYRTHTGRPLWDKIAATVEEARAYYASIDEEQRREEAATILASGGWTRSACWHVFS